MDKIRTKHGVFKRPKSREKDRPAATDYDSWPQELKDAYTHIFNKLKKTNIIELREQAARAGVKSATTFEKSDLLVRMASLQVKNTVFAAVPVGEPQEVQSDEIDALIKDYLGSTYIAMPKDCLGVVHIENNTTAWVRPKFIEDKHKDYYLPMRLVNDYGLISGDYITGKARALERASRYGI